MSNVLIGIIGVILFIGLALAGALFLGDRFKDANVDSKAARYISEGGQISKAYELYALNEGRFPDGLRPDGTPYSSTSNRSKLVQLNETGYLKAIPEGGNQSGTEAPWYIDETRGAALTLIGSDTGSEDICRAARRRVGFTDDPKSCDANDILANDPCCVG